MCAIRILIVEDDPDVSELLRTTLDPPYECLCAYNGLEGWQAALEGQPDIIITDVMMPVMDGREFVIRLRQEATFNATPVIFLTALGAREEIRKGYELGATLYLTKPIDPQRLTRNIELFVKDYRIQSRPKRKTVEQVERELAGPHAKLKKAGAAAPAEAETAPAAEPKTPPAAESKADAEVRRVVRREPNVPVEKSEEARPRIIIVEDDDESREMMRDGLEGRFEVLVASNGVEAIERAARYEPDVFILDGMLPKMTGYQLTAMLRKNRMFHASPIVFISGRATARDKQYAEKLGVQRFLAKPFDIDRLEKAIDEVVAAPGFQVRPKRLTMRQAKLEFQRDFETSRGR